MKTYARYWFDILSYSLRGSRLWHFWLGALTLIAIAGIYAYTQQLIFGLSVTNLSDQVSWGAYIANFTYLVGVSDAAVLLVIPAYIYGRREIRDVVLLGMVLSIAAIIMSLLFIMVDLGRPDNFLHILPFFGRLNFPRSVLAWDVVFLNGYLVLSLHVPGYILYMKYLGRRPDPRFYLPVVIVSILWAVSVHTVTAFLYSGLGSRPYWNAAILAPRFLVSSFTCGSALLILVFSTAVRVAGISISDVVFKYLRGILFYTLLINLFLLASEVFKEFYTDSVHVASARYLFFGLHGHGVLVPFIWSAIAMEVAALVIVLTKARRGVDNVYLVACLFVVLGVWIEKGMGLVIPGFVPTPLGDIVEYTPSLIEILVCAGIWAIGTLIFTMSAKVVVGVTSGRLRRPGFVPTVGAKP